MDGSTPLFFSFDQVTDDAESLELIIPGLHRGEIGLLVAQTEVGKTTWTRNLSISLAAGRSFANFLSEGKQRRVAYFDFEEGSPATLKQDITTMVDSRFPELADTVSGNLQFCLPGDWWNKADLRRSVGLVEAIKQGGYDLVIIDNFSAAFSLESENDNDQVKQRVLEPLKDLARQCNLAILLIHHTGKPAEGKSGAMLSRGASVLPQLCRLVINLTKKGNTVNFEVVKDKTRTAKSDVLTLNVTSRWFECRDQKAITTETGRSAINWASSHGVHLALVEHCPSGKIKQADLARWIETTKGVKIGKVKMSRIVKDLAGREIIEPETGKGIALKQTTIDYDDSLVATAVINKSFPLRERVKLETSTANVADNELTGEASKLEKFQ